MPSRRSVVLLHLLYGLTLNFILFGRRAFFAVALMFIGYALLEGPPPLLVLAVLMIFNTCVHIWHYFNCVSSWSMEVTGTCILMFQRIVSLAFNLQDGRSPNKLRAVYERYRLQKKPPAIEIFAYFITPFGGTTGPGYEFCYFDHMLELPNRPRLQSDSPFHKRALLYWFLSLYQALIALIFGSICTVEFYYSSFYLEAPWIAKIALVTCISLFWASKYYVTWYAVQAALLESGIGDCQYGKEEDWSNMTVWYFLQSLSISEWFQRWNHATHLFWKNYLFLRVLDAKIPVWIGRTLVFICSAVWHGVKPSYYLVLPEVLLFMVGDSLLLKKLPITRRDPFRKRIIRQLYVIVAMFSTSSGWWFGTFEAYWHIHMSHWFGADVMALILYVIVWFLPNAKKDREVKKAE